MAQRSTSSKCARLSAPPPQKAPCFKFFLTKHIWNAPTCTFHHNLFLVELVTMAQRSRSSKCARLSSPPKRPHVSDFFEPSIFGMPQPVPFTTTCFWSNWSQWLRDPGPQSVLDYPPQKKGCMFQVFLNPAYLECPNLYLSPQPVFGRIGHNGSEIQVLKVCSTIRPRPPKWPHVSDFFEPSIFGMPQPVPFTTTCFWSNWSQWLGDPGPQSVLDYPPQKKGRMFQIFLNPAYLECPNLYLSPQPVFRRIGHNGSEVRVLKVCSTIPPPPHQKAPCL